MVPTSAPTRASRAGARVGRRADVVLAGNEPVMRGFNPSAALSSGLNFAVRRGFGRHCSELVGLSPVGQDLPQAAPSTIGYLSPMQFEAKVGVA